MRLLTDLLRKNLKTQGLFLTQSLINSIIPEMVDAMITPHLSALPKNEENSPPMPSRRRGQSNFATAYNK
jgi:hypothetical protein